MTVTGAILPTADATTASPSPATAARPLRAAVVGTGKISEEHLRYLSGDPGVALAGVCDLSPSLAAYAATRFKAERSYSSSAAMLRDARPDVVHVLTPPHTHAALVTESIEAGAHVVVEKPLATTNSGFRDLWTLARGRGRWIVEDHNYRFNEPILAIERLVADGELGAVREVDARMVLSVRKTGGRYMDASLPHPSHNLPAGIIHEFITHLCYLALRFLPVSPGGGDWDRVMAAWSKHGDEPLFKFDDLDALVLSGPVHARIRFSSHAGPECFAVTVRGEKGWAETDLFQPHLRVVKPRRGGAQLSPLLNHWLNGAGLMAASVRGFRNKVMQKTPYEGLRTFLNRTYSAFREGRPPPVTFDDMDRASRLIDALVDCQ